VLGGPFYDSLRAALHGGIRWVHVGFAGTDGLFAEGLVDERRHWTASYGVFAQPVSEFVVASVLAIAREFPLYAQAERWVTDERGRLLSDLTIGIVGGGGIGARSAALLSRLGCRVRVVSRSGRPVDGAQWTKPTAALPELLADSDVVVLAAPLTDETRGLIGAAALRSMRRDAWLVNIARGGLVVTADLVAALDAGEVAGAVLDVTEPEPLPDGHPLWQMPNVWVTPHIACTPEMVLRLMGGRVTENISRFRAREPLLGLIVPSRGY
jgi:D-3-phosphoglycerate dehydrogenase